jgi:hypothetical protein
MLIFLRANLVLADGEDGRVGRLQERAPHQCAARGQKLEHGVIVARPAGRCQTE